MDNPFELSPELAADLSEIPMRCITREYPNAPGLLLQGLEDLREPHENHPAFYGCLDWHSAVHMHWTLIRLLRRFDLPRPQEIRDVLNGHLTAENLRVEAEYFVGRPTFERPYGWVWLLTLASELRDWKGDADAERWLANLLPLEETIIRLFENFLGKQSYPIRTGTHGNTAFALTLVQSCEMTSVNANLLRAIRERAVGYYYNDQLKPAPLTWEPGGNDFLSPSLVEARLMSQILSRDEFVPWFSGFLPDLGPLLTPAFASDRSDPQIAHLDGLNLSRAWCLREIAAMLGGTPYGALLEQSARDHAVAGLASLSTGHYEGEHWLASFAMLMFG